MEQNLDLMGAIVEKPEYNRDGGQEKIINQEASKEGKTVGVDMGAVSKEDC